MMKDDWPPGMTDQYHTKNFKVKIQPAHGEKDDWSPLGMTDQYP